MKTYNKTYKIYGLHKHNSDIIRYIGITGNSLKRRLSQHIYDRKLKVSHKNNWIRGIYNNGESINIILIDEVRGIKEARMAEIEYIKLFKSFGAKLVNGTNGGEVFKHTEETKKKISQKLSGKGNGHYGRHYELSPNSKITKEIADEICGKWKFRVYTEKMLAKEYGMSLANIQRLRKKQRINADV